MYLGQYFFRIEWMIYKYIVTRCFRVFHANAAYFDALFLKHLYYRNNCRRD